MSRPETITDLPVKDRIAPVVTIHATDVAALDGEALRSLSDVRAMLDSTCWLKPWPGEDGGTVFRRLMTPAEERDVLSDAQDRWDWRQGWYERAAAGEVVDGWIRYFVDRHARAEGLDPIDWDALDAAEAAEGGEVR
ncbi:DUF7432 family protein [Actinomyces faecalis]|uniref:DUF7432 family protein n=1 Tax=Actinomyces faecalis TaxID=2722820 RepID=UPI0015540D16|nr:hypothetical protein [Actinomyces faecalis]